MPARIIVPYTFGGPTLSQLAAEIVAASPNNTLPDEIVFDFSRLNFIKPTGVVFLSNVTQWLESKQRRVSFDKLNPERTAIRFLDDSLFFEQHLGRKLLDYARPRATTKPLQKVLHQDSHSWLEVHLVPWLSSQLRITQASLYPLKNCLAELFNNIRDHTKFDIGSVFVQFFPAINDITIAISDFGSGIPSKVREIEDSLSDSDCICKAVQEGFTTKSVQSNAGIGLHYLLNTVAIQMRGVVTIYSSRGIVRFFANGERLNYTASGGEGFCPGTTFAIELRTDRIPRIADETEDLQW